MKAPLEWLSQYVDLTESLDDLVQRLIMSGTEVEEVIRLGENWDDVVVGQVLEKDVPPGSKHLSVVRIDLGDRRLTAVTGAPNIEAGQKVPVVLLGGTVPVGPDGESFVLQPRPMMGITGEGMVLSERELGISDEHGGILVLPETSEVGRRLADILGGVFLDVDAKGRPDELSILGVAREIAAVTGKPLREPDLSSPESRSSLDGKQTENRGLRIGSGPSATIRVDAPDLCPRFSAVRIDGIAIRPSPQWLSRRLEAAGVRSINNVVDVTNYVMLELGQPLHAYDFAEVPEATLIVRRAHAGERIVTLDGLERELTEEMVLVCDPTGPSGIGGIMGGGRSEISESTTSILLEAANWDRVNIRRSSRRLGLRTEASARFERGVPPELTLVAIERCLNLLPQVVDGPLTVYELVDVAAEMKPPASISFDLAGVERLLGVRVSKESAVAALARLGFTSPDSGSGETRATNPGPPTHSSRLTTIPPYWRRDVENVADIAEEIARMIGYDAIPERLPGQETQPVPLPPDLGWENAVREKLWALGLSEAWTDTLTSSESLSRLDGSHQTEAGGSATNTRSEAPKNGSFVANPGGVARHQALPGPIHLANPPSAERAVLRNTVIPSLLDIAGRNLKRTHERIAFFEIARTFFPRESDLPYERRTLGIVLAGDRDPRIWNRPQTHYDFFDLKGIVDAVLGIFIPGSGSNQLMHSVPASSDETGTESHRNAAQPPADMLPGYLHPGRSAFVHVATDPVGHLGELHPLAARAFDIEPPIRAYAAEIDLDTLMAHATAIGKVRPISRFPGVNRDIAMTFPTTVSSAAIEDLVRRHGGDLLVDLRIVDVYAGEGIDPDRRSLALGLEFQSETETLTQEAVSTVQESIVAALTQELDGVLRT